MNQLMKFLQPKYVLLILGLLAFGIMAMLATKIWFIKTVKKDPAMVALAKAAGKIRTTEARLSSEFAYAPYVALPPSNKERLRLEALRKELILSEEADLSKAKNSYNNKVSGNSVSRGANEQISNNFYEGIFLDPVLSNFYFSDLISFLPARLSLTRSADETSNTSKAKTNETKAFRTLAAEIMLDDIVAPTLETAHATAVIHLLRHEIDLSIKRFELALEEIPEAKKNAIFLNDLAVAYLARAHDEEQPADIFEALSIIDSAVTADPNLLAAQYNRALILQKLYLYISARKYWNEYLAKEKSDEWKAEINKYIEELNKPTLTALWEKEKPKVGLAALRGDYTTVKQIVSEYPHFARMYALDELFPSWATSYLERDFDTGEEVLRVIQAIGKVLIEIHQDHMIDDGLSTIYRVYDQPNAAKNLTQLAQAHLLYNEGRKLDENNDLGKASKPLAKALVIFNQYNDNAFITLTYFYQVRSYFYSLETKIAFDRLQEVVSLSEKHKYPYVSGRVWSISVQEQKKLFQFTKALEAMPLAIKYLEQTKALNNLVINLVSYGQLLTELNESKKVLPEYHQAFKAISKLKNYSRQATVIGVIATYLAQKNYPKSAFYFFDELLHIATENNLSKHLFATFRWRSLVYYKLGNYNLALQDIHQARIYSELFSDKATHLLAENELNTAEGQYNPRDTQRGKKKKS
jgi:hypothetical protein